MHENSILLVTVKYTLVCLESALVVFGCTTHDFPHKSKAVNWQSWGHYSKNVTHYILLVTSMQCNALQLHITPGKTVTSYILHVTLMAVLVILLHTYYICSLQAIC